MAIYRLIIKTSPDVSLPVAPGPTHSGPAVWGSSPTQNVPPLTPRFRPEFIPACDVPYRIKPHPVLNVSTWEDRPTAYPPRFPKQRPERSLGVDIEYRIKPHPSYSPAVWEQSLTQTRPPKPAFRFDPQYQLVMWDLPYRALPHPVLNIASWEQSPTQPKPPAPVKQRAEWSPLFDYPFRIGPHPSLDAATWDVNLLLQRIPPPPDKPPRPPVDEPAVLPPVILSSISTWSHLEPAVAPIPKRWVRPFIDEPMAYAAANPSLIWTRWNSDAPIRPPFNARAVRAVLAEQPFISAVAQVLTPDDYQGPDPLRSRPTQIVRPPVDYSVWTVKHPSLNVASWEMSDFPIPPAVERRSYAERRKHDEPQFLPRNPAAAQWSHLAMDRQWITRSRRQMESMPKLPLIDDVFWVLLVRNLLPDSIIATMKGYLNDRELVSYLTDRVLGGRLNERDLEQILDDRTLLAKFLKRTMENL